MEREDEGRKRRRRRIDFGNEVASNAPKCKFESEIRQFVTAMGLALRIKKVKRKK